MKIIAMALAFVAAFSGNGGGDEKDKAKMAVRLKPSTAVRGLDVTIGELCELPANDAAATALGQIRFGKAPVLGFSRTIARSEIVQRIAATGIDLSTLVFSGADEIVVQPVQIEIAAQDLLDAATNALQAQLAIEGGDVEIEAPRQMRHVQAPPGRASQDLSARVRGTRTGPNSAVVDVDVLVDGESWKKIPVQFKLVRFQQVLKTLGTLRAGTPLGPDNIELAREPVDQAPGLFLARFEQVDNMIAARNLAAGQRMTLVDIAPPAVIQRGEVVTVVLTHGRVKVTAKAMANHDAPLGGRITLTSVSSRTSMTGIVQAPGLVVIPQ